MLGFLQPSNLWLSLHTVSVAADIRARFPPSEDAVCCCSHGQSTSTGQNAVMKYPHFTVTIVFTSLLLVSHLLLAGRSGRLNNASHTRHFTDLIAISVSLFGSLLGRDQSDCFNKRSKHLKKRNAEVVT